LPFAQVSGTTPSTDRHLKNVQLGLDPAGPPATAVVGTVLGSTNASYGLTQVDHAGPGNATTTAGDVGGLTSRTTAGGTAHGHTDLYFDIDDSVARTSSYDAKFTISYYDAGTGSISHQYDNGPGDPNHTAGTIPLTGSNTWKTATISASGAYLGDLEAANADFRLHAGTGITVHSVGVAITGPAVPSQILFPPAPAIATPKSGSTVKLASSISGTAEPDGRVSVIEGSSTLCATTAADSGAWSCPPTDGLKPGRHTITATATDPTGLTSPASAPVSFDASDLPPGTAVVGAIVGTTNSSYGMSEDETPSPGFDGPTTASDIAGLSARTSTSSNIYFNIDDAIAHAGDYAAKFTVSYYDQGNGSFSVQYDDGSGDPYRSTASIPLIGSNTWKTATVSAADAYFGGAQHSSAEFRLRNGGGHVTVHSVVVSISGDGVPTVTHFPPPVEIASPASGATVATSTPTVSGTAGPEATVTVDADGADVCTATVSDSGAWSCTPSTGLAAGQHSLTASATDVTPTLAGSSPVQITVQP
jgi:hypothetical protein